MLLCLIWNADAAKNVSVDKESSLSPCEDPGQVKHVVLRRNAARRPFHGKRIRGIPILEPDSICWIDLIDWLFIQGLKAKYVYFMCH